MGWRGHGRTYMHMYPVDAYHFHRRHDTFVPYTYVVWICIIVCLCAVWYGVGWSTSGSVALMGLPHGPASLWRRTCYPQQGIPLGCCEASTCQVRRAFPPAPSVPLLALNCGGAL